MLFRITNASQGQINLGIINKVELPEHTPIWRARRLQAHLSVSSYTIPHGGCIDIESGSLEELLRQPQVSFFRERGQLQVTEVEYPPIPYASQEISDNVSKQNHEVIEKNIVKEIDEIKPNVIIPDYNEDEIEFDNVYKQNQEVIEKNSDVTIEEKIELSSNSANETTELLEGLHSFIENNSLNKKHRGRPKKQA